MKVYFNFCCAIITDTTCMWRNPDGAAAEVTAELLHHRCCCCCQNGPKHGGTTAEGGGNPPLNIYTPVALQSLESTSTQNDSKYIKLCIVYYN